MCHLKRIAGIVAVVTVAMMFRTAAATEQRPNILLIITDQQRYDMLSCAGNPWVKTPNLDRLAAAGTRFELAFCTFPLCSPSRFSMFSGVMPSRIHQESNAVVPVPAAVLDNSMGKLLGRAGYETVYGGKIHLPCPNRPQSAGYGFERNLTADMRDELAKQCAAYLGEKHERPFLLVASFNNPHDICSMSSRDYTQSSQTSTQRSPKEDPEILACLERALRRPVGVSDETFFKQLCPPLPANYAESPELAAIMSPPRGKLAFEHTQWTDRDWQLHRWAYARLTEQVDAQIGVVLDALRKAGLEKNTLVVSVSDHGEMDAAHHLGHKQFLYEEAIRVPLILAWPDHIRNNTVDREHLVSTGLDLIPTLCDFAGVPVPDDLTGRSLKPLAEGQPVDSWRRGLVIENANGVAYRNARSKYVVFHEKNSPLKEAVIDLSADPGEMHNAASNSDGAQRIEAGHADIVHWYQAHGETLDARYRVAAPRP